MKEVKPDRRWSCLTSYRRAERFSASRENTAGGRVKLAQKDLLARKLAGENHTCRFRTKPASALLAGKNRCQPGRPSIDLLRALIAQEPLLGAKEKQQNIDATWQALSSMTQEQANTLVINADENILKAGWITTLIWFDNRNDPT